MELHTSRNTQSTENNAVRIFHITVKTPASVHIEYTSKMTASYRNEVTAPRVWDSEHSTVLERKQ